MFVLDFGNLRTVLLVCLLWKCFSHFAMVNNKSSLPYIQSTVRLPLIDGFIVKAKSPSDNTASCLRSVFTHVHISLQINVLLRFSGQHLHIFDWRLCLRCWVPSSSMFAPFSSSLDTLRLHKVQLRLLIGMFCSRDHCARPGWFPGLLDTLDYVGLKHFWKFEVVWYSMIMYASMALVCFNMGHLEWSGDTFCRVTRTHAPSQFPMTSPTSSSRAGTPVAWFLTAALQLQVIKHPDGHDLAWQLYGVKTRVLLWKADKNETWDDYNLGCQVNYNVERWQCVCCTGVFRKQLEKEKQKNRLHRQSTELCN